MSSGKRYKFNGSSFGVQTGLGTAKTITAVTQANPGLVTSTAHGFVLGGVVKFSSISGMTQLNGNLFPVDDPTTNDFEIPINTTAYTAFATGSPANGIAEPVVFSEFCELTGVNQQGAAANQIEVTTICSTAKEFEVGLSDSGTLALDFNWAGNEAVQAAMNAAKISGDPLAFKVTFPGDGGFAIMIGTILSTSFQGAVNAVWKASASVKLTGEVYVLPSAG